MTTQLPQPRIPSPSEIVAPIVTIENSLIGAVQAPFQGLGIPVPPRIIGPVAIISQILGQLPAAPQLPKLPSLPNLPSLST